MFTVKLQKTHFTGYMMVFCTLLLLCGVGTNKKVNAADMGATINVASPASIDGVSVSSSTITITGGTFTLTGTTTSRCIVVNGETTLYLNGVSVTSNSNPPLRVNSVANVTLVLLDGKTNKFVCTKTTAGSNAAINVETGKTLTINAEGLGTGSLTATASAGQGGGGGAGIGGNGSSSTGFSAGSCGTIIVNGGNIVASGGNYSSGSNCGGGGAGIGGGGSTGTAAYKGGTPGSGGTITVNGGNVTATGGSGYGGGSGIGGGGAAYSVGGNNGTVNINGGTTIATGGRSFTSGGSGGAGIGGGGRSISTYTSGNGGIVNINGGKVIATGSTASTTQGGGAGIGGGGGSSVSSTQGAGAGSALHINYTADVKAYSSSSLPALHSEDPSLIVEDAAYVINASFNALLAGSTVITTVAPSSKKIVLEVPNNYKNFALSTTEEGPHSISALSNSVNRQVVLVSDGSNDICSSKTITPTQNVELGSELIPTIYVFFEPNGGIQQPDAKEVTIGQNYGELPSVDRKGYVFIGWFIEE